MGREDQIINERIKKIEELKKLGISPYPTRFDKKENVGECLNKKMDSPVKTAGRLITKRELGKISFAKLRDYTGDIQLVFQEGKTPEKVFSFFSKYIDAGDFVGVDGEVFKTKTNEISILVKNLELLTKSILPLPEKFHGLQNDEERLRKRYLEIITSSEIKELFIRKSKFWQSMRNFLISKGFMEVETPALENTPGGAEAKPFITHHNALNLNVYLRISPELWLKRLMVAGYPKVFEIGRIFRNEGMDAEHLQDYTQMEFYWAYADYNEGMKLVEEMYKYIAKEVYQTLKFKIKEFDVDLGKKWETYDFVEIIKKITGIDVLKTNQEEIEKKLRELKIEYDKKGFNITRAVDNLWKYCRKKVSGPGFLINVPVFMEPLAKRSEKNPEVVERYQIIIAGSEVGKGFSELNDPIDQLERFQNQQKLRDAGDEEAQMEDDDFVEALKYGMPPTTGFGISERLFAFLENKPIRECVIFPLMRPSKKEKMKNLPISKEEAIELLKKYPQENSDMNHYLESAAVMKQVAKSIGEDEKYYEMLGLLHDVDWSLTKNNPSLHLTFTPEILKEKGFDKEFIDIIISHGYGYDCSGLKNKKREKKIEFILAASETITGIIHAYALMRAKKISDMEVSGLKKKFKDKTFAAGCNREIILEIEKAGISLEDFFRIAIEGIKNIKEQVGLE